MTGFGEILPLWQKGKNLLRRRYLLQNCEPTVAKISCLLPNFPCSKSPNIEKLSSHLVTLLSLSLSLSLSFFHTLTLVSTNKEGKKIFDEKQQMAEKFSAFKAIITFCFKVISSLCFSIFLFHRRLIHSKYFFLSLFVTFHFSQNISIFHSMACVAPLQSLCSPTIYLLPTYDPLMKSHLVFCYFHFFLQ